MKTQTESQRPLPGRYPIFDDNQPHESPDSDPAAAATDVEEIPPVRRKYKRIKNGPYKRRSTR